MERFHCFGTGGEKSPALFCPWANTCSIVLCYFGQQPEKRISTHSSRPYTRNSFHENTSVYARMCVENPVIIKLSSQVLVFCFPFSCGTVREKKASHNMADINTFVYKMFREPFFLYHAHSYTLLANNQIAFYSEKPIEVGMLVFLMWWLLPDFAYTWQYLHQQRIAWREVNKYKHLIACLISDRHGGGAASRTQEKPAFTK